MIECRSEVRVAVLTNTVPTYRRPVFEELARTPGISLRMFLSLPAEHCDPQALRTLPVTFAAGLNLRWRTKHKDVGTVQSEALHVPIALYGQLTAYRPHVVISGEFGLRSLVAYLVAARLRVPMVLWTEEIAQSAWGIGRVQRLLRSFLIPRASAFLAWGDPAAWYLTDRGVAREQIYLCAQAVDNQFWRTAAATTERAAPRANLRARGRVFLAVGRFVARKGFDLLLRAWAEVPQSVRAAHVLVLVGSGPEDERLRALAVQLNLSDTVRFAGPHYGADLARHYAAADVFVFPSLVDVWGLVVNEALACGLPVIASRFAGSSQQLIANEHNGTLVDPTDVHQFSAVLRDWCLRERLPDPELCRETLRGVDFEVTVAAIRAVIRRYVGQHAQSSTLFGSAIT